MARRATTSVPAAGAALLLLAGCGGATDPAGRAAPGAKVSAAEHARQVAVHRRVIASLHHLAAGHVPYGGIPPYLPTATAPAHRVVAASADHHVLALEGDTVALSLPTGDARVTVVGPDVPDRYHGTDRPKAPATFTVTVAAVRGSVALRRRFTITDEEGAVHRPTVVRRGGGRAPARVASGRSAVLSLHTRLPIGNGRLRYSAPGARPLVAWDFDAETD